MKAETDGSERKAAIELRLFGAFALRVDGAEVAGVPEPAQEILARLALAGARGLDRPEVAAALWPLAEDERARFYLRRCLSQLRTAFGPHRERLGALGERRVALDLGGCRCDVAEFEAGLRNGDECGMVAAATSVSGDFMAGHRSEWVRQTRQYYRERTIELLYTLAQGAEKAGDLDDAAEWLAKAKGADPLREETCRRLMRVLGLKGDFARTVRLFRDLKAGLRQELGLNPAPETVDLYRKLLAHAGPGRMLRSEPPRDRVPHLTPLPEPAAPFVGRKAELDELRAAVCTSRLVTVIGPGGVGKTRIAVECARAVAGRFAAGVAFADMFACSAGEEVAERIAGALGTADDVSFDHIVRASSGPLLLVVDGVEHVADDSAAVFERLLRAAPDVHVLCTSQVSLPIPDQHVVSLGPMGLPPLGLEPSEDIEGFDAIAFFLERAGRAAPAFRLNADNRRHVVELCRRLDGMPLALALAAVRLRTMPVADIVANLDDRFRLLDIPEGTGDRRRTLQGVLDWSFRLLPQPERRLFVRLGVFPHSWTLAAAKAVCGDSDLEDKQIPTLLGNLVDHSLVTFQRERAGGIYAMLETQASYAKAHLAEYPELRDALAKRHADFYLHAAETLRADRADGELFESDEPNYLTAIDAFLADESPDSDVLALRLVNRLLPRRQEAFAHSKELREALHVLGKVGEQPTEPLVECLFRAACAAHNLYQIDLANGLLERAEAMAGTLGLDAWATATLRGRGEVAADEGRLDEAEPLLTAALSRYRAADDPLGEAWCLGMIGYVKRQRGDLREARELTEAALTLHSAHDDVTGRLWCMGSLAAAHLEAGDADQAVPLLQATLAHHEALGYMSGRIWNLTMLGIAEARDGRLAVAEAHIGQALVLLGEDPDDLRKAWQMMELGDIQRRAGRIDEAESTLVTALRLSKAGGSTTLEVRSLMRLCAVSIDRKDWSSARAYRDAARRTLSAGEAAQLSGELDEVASQIP